MNRWCITTGMLVLTLFSCSKEPVGPSERASEGIRTVHRIRFLNTINDSVSVLIDGRHAGQDVKDRPISTDSAFIEIRDVTTSSYSNRLIAFASGRKPIVIEDVDWDTDLDTLLTFEESVTLPILGWILYVGNTSFQYVTNRIRRGMEDCNRIYYHEGTGLQYDISFIDATSFENIAQHYDISTVRDMETVATLLNIPDNVLNLFFTRTAAGSPSVAFTTYGLSEQGNCIAFGMYRVDGSVIGHEIGHTLSLLHYEGEDVGMHNVMTLHSIRVFFTDGQVGRMWLDPESALGKIYEIPRPLSARSEEYLPNPHANAWPEMDIPPYFELFFDNDIIQ